MDLDMTEYDQVEEIRLIMENNGQMYCDGASSKFLVTLSSTCSEQTSLDDANCENDFVFLPAPPKLEPKSISRAPQQSPTTNNINIVAPRSQQATTPTAKHNSEALVFFSQQQQPFSSLSQATNPFQLRHPSLGVQKIDYRLQGEPSKPVGLLDFKPNFQTDTNKLAELMQQIVTRCDSINISIPCAYCSKLISCPPSDISKWLDHMASEHNSKPCPICSKLIGLGPNKEVDIIKRHVLAHFDECWVEKSAQKVNFTHGLQQEWFSSNNCSVKDASHKF